MASSRIDDLRRRVEADPASIAFAQLAEEYRRSGQTEEAVRVSREGLKRHPGYLSARVTLGRALLDLGQLDAARDELDFVATEAPENLAAVRGLAEICHREGEMGAALGYYQRALALARHDPELEEIVQQLSRQVGAEAGSSTGLSFEEAHHELQSAADRMPETRAGGAAITSAAGDSTAPFDFDRLVAALGTPAAAPQPDGADGAIALPTLEEMLPLTDGGDPFAALEAELRDHVHERFGDGLSAIDAGAVQSAAEPSTGIELSEVPGEGGEFDIGSYDLGALAEPEDHAHALLAAAEGDTLAEPAVVAGADAAAEPPATAGAEVTTEPDDPHAGGAVPERDPGTTADVPVLSWSYSVSDDPVVGRSDSAPVLDVVEPVPDVPTELGDSAPIFVIDPVIEGVHGDPPPVDEPAADESAAGERSDDAVTADERTADALTADGHTAEDRTSSDPAADGSVAKPSAPAGDDVLGDLENWLHTLQDRSGE